MTAISELAAFIHDQARGGLSRLEIAAALGVTVARLEARGEVDERVAAALELADEAAEAWWLAMPRRLLREGKSLNGAAWRAAMEWRFRSQADEAASEPKLGRDARGRGTINGRLMTPDEIQARETVIFDIPDNGRTRRRRVRRDRTDEHGDD